MISGIIGGQAVKNNPVLRVPSALTAKAITTGATNSPQVNISLGTAADVSATQSTTTDANLVNVTSGKGVLLFCAFHSGTNAGSCVGTIIIDGVTVFSLVSTGVSSLLCPVGCVSALDNTLGTSTISFEAVPFYSSLVIKYKSSVGAVVVGAAAKYRLAN